MNIYIENQNDILHETSVDFILRPCAKEIHIVQYDKSLPVIKVELFRNGERYALPENAIVNVRVGKIDHTFVYESVLGTNQERNVVYFEVSEQMATIAGRISPVIEVIEGSKVACSSPIQFVIERNPIQEGQIESHDDFPIIYELQGTVADHEERIQVLESHLEGEAVTLHTDQYNIDGEKTFLSNVYFSDTSTLCLYFTATDPSHAINKGYVDGAIQTAVEELEIRSDVIDVLGTYQDLQNYDTSSVGLNDLIKVISDETHNNATSYYRWVEISNVKQWSYIASEGPYYTISQADNKFVSKVSYDSISGNKDFTGWINFNVDGNTAAVRTTQVPSHNNDIIPKWYLEDKLANLSKKYVSYTLTNNVRHISDSYTFDNDLHLTNLVYNGSNYHDYRLIINNDSLRFERSTTSSGTTVWSTLFMLYSNQIVCNRDLKLSGGSNPILLTDGTNSISVAQIVAKYDKPTTGIPASDLAQTYIVANEFNIQNGTGTNAVRQKMADETVNFVGRNPNAETLDPTISTTITTGASGSQSSAFGKNTMALGTASFTNGNKTLAKGEESHAEGYQSVTLGDGSHAEGARTTAVGLQSHSEGADTIANGEASHAEGHSTKANEYYAHAEGEDTIASGHASHAEGEASQATALGSHAEGTNNYIGVKPQDGPGGGGEVTPSQPSGYVFAAGESAHAEGFDNFVYGAGSHAEGTQNVINGTMSHAEGVKNTIGDTDGAHAEGYQTTVTGTYAHAEGQLTKAEGYASHAEGTSTRAVGTCSHAEGATTTAYANFSHTMGIGTYAGNESMLAIGKYNNFKANTLFEIGNGSADNSRSNAFEVYLDGHAEIGLMGSTPMSVATKQYADTKTKVNLNGSDVITATIWAPITSGTNGQILKSNGAGSAPVWIDMPTSLIDDVQVEGQSVVVAGIANITKTGLGLGNVDNTSDLNKPVSTAQQTAIDTSKKYSNSNPTTVAVGGIPKNSTFSNKTIQEVLDMLFYPEIPLGNLSVNSNQSSGSFEYGTSRTISTVTPTFTVGSYPITSFKIGTTLGGNNIYDGTATSGTAITLSSPITWSGQSIYTLYCTLTDGHTTKTASLTYSPTYSSYYKVDSSTTTPTSSLTKDNGVDSSSGTSITYAAGDYIYIYSHSKSGSSHKIQTNVFGQWADVSVGTTYIGSVNITNSAGATVSYYAYRTTSPMAGAGSGTFRLN